MDETGSEGSKAGKFTKKDLSISTFGVPKVKKFEIRIPALLNFFHSIGSKSETTAPTVFKVGAGHGKSEFSNVQMTKTGLI
jgi:hypothetical protein